MGKNYVFIGCHCQFEVIRSNPTRLKFHPDISNLCLTCPLTWDLISSGNTKGCFQLDTQLGQMLAKKINPSNIEELSALISIARPGCLEAEVSGKTITNRYIDRKHGREPVEYFHSSLEPILKDSYGLMIYQEQALRIAKDIAGFSLVEANSLRKAIGKKIPELMAEMKNKFLKGCKDMGIVKTNEAESLFAMIEKSQRYSFNASHAVSYALNGYLSAYTKAHFPKEFFTSYLHYAKDKPKPLDEIRELVHDARIFNVNIHPPSIATLNHSFKIVDEHIRFGLSNVKGVGQSVISKMEKSFDLDKVKTWGWMDCLILLCPKVNKTALRALIGCGAFSHLGKNRKEMIFEYDIYMGLTAKEKEKIAAIHDNTPFSCLKEILEFALENHTTHKIAANKNRLEKMKGWLKMIAKPPTSLEDSAEWISGIEKTLMGVAITCSAVDDCLHSASAVCCDLVGKSLLPEKFTLACVIDSIKETKTKRGKNPGQKMAFLTVSDSTGMCESIIAWPKTWKEEYSNLALDNKVLLSLKRVKDKSYEITSVKQLT